MKRLLYLVALLPTTALAQGWGNVANQQEDKGFSWTDPLWPAFWMAWTPATFALFCGIFGAIAIIGLLEVVKYRDGIERRGIFGLTTTLGDRLFISLLGSAYIFLLWLGLMGQPLWIPLGLAIVWGVFCFWKV
ncbi:DUF2160 domain-containing protein [uncultured Tateyamaria sp.]|uniref:DUF2160 domain-containing protein n=1 Tax=uncultured Tateyamaria sp. TaxID=455651 RepID=UPI00261C2393|nr:DUF2160 domain-containing protein [uncultured Tateyamaria sp.]